MESSYVLSWMMLLENGEFDNATVEHTLKIMEEAIEKNEHLYPIRSVISDHGFNSMPTNMIKMVMRIIH